jgi:DNA-binding CsgD family transcriptional regulator/Tfp pilus assembly protein PilF
MPGQVVGRDAELASLDSFLSVLKSAPAAVVIAGPAGAGKTTLLRSGLDQAVNAGLTVLRTQPSRSDMRLAFAGLTDLLGSRLDAVLPELPAPQRRALGVALLVEDAAPTPPEPNVIAVAFRSALLVLAASAPVVIVIDDVQWLDAPTAATVGFALRRLSGQRVGLLCAQRTDRLEEQLPLELDRAAMTADVLPLGGLSLGALHRMLRSRLNQSFSHPTLRRIHADSAGNPFVALEIARALIRRGITRVASGPLPVPDTLTGLVGERLQDLPDSVTGALSMVAVMPDRPMSGYVAAGVAGRAIDAAVMAGVLEAYSGQLRFSHPLLAAAVLGAIPPARKRELHALAADAAADGEERARHRALAAGSPSDEIAAELDEVAVIAERRGAPATAAELLELAATMTPNARAGDAHHRLLAAGKLLTVAGENRAAYATLSHLVGITPEGPLRAEAMAHLGWSMEDDFEASMRMLEQALQEAGDVPALRACIHAFMTDHWAILGDEERARAEIERALEYAEKADDPKLLGSTLGRAFYFTWSSDHDVDEAMIDRALELERRMDIVGHEPPSQWAGLYLMAVGRLDEARVALERALARAEVEGVAYVRADMLLRLSMVATRTGDPVRGAELALAGLDIAEQLDLGQLTAALLHGCALAALHRGQADVVTECVSRGLELSRKTGDRVYLLANEALLGSLDLALGNAAAAAARYLTLVEALPRAGRNLRRTIGYEAAEALIGVGDLDGAEGLLAVSGSRSYDAVADALAARCRGAIAASRGDLREAVTELNRALALQDRVTLEPVSRGRTLLLLGSVHRRQKQRRAARQVIGEAITLFGGAGAQLWLERAREELARVSGRVAAGDELSVTEMRVTELVISGQSNKEIASEMFVTVRTVESTLTRIYSKLGVQSRTQLARAMRDRG